MSDLDAVKEKYGHYGIPGDHRWRSAPLRHSGDDRRAAPFHSLVGIVREEEASKRTDRRSQEFSDRSRRERSSWVVSF